LILKSQSLYSEANHMTYTFILSLLFLLSINLLICGLIGQLVGALISGFLGGLAGAEIDRSTIPNQGIWQSLRNGIILSVIGPGVLASLFILFGLPIFVGAALGLLLGLFALEATLKHFFLRVVLYGSGWSPWNYTNFLNYSTNSILLQRIGGGYIFTHRSLLEHFASLPIGQSNKMSRNIVAQNEPTETSL